MTEYCPGCGLKPSIERCGLPSIFLAYITHGPETSDDIVRLVGRAIVDHNDLVRRPGLRKHAFQTAWQKPGVIVGANDDRCLGVHGRLEKIHILVVSHEQNVPVSVQTEQAANLGLVSALVIHEWAVTFRGQKPIHRPVAKSIRSKQRRIEFNDNPRPPLLAQSTRTLKRFEFMTLCDEFNP